MNHNYIFFTKYHIWTDMIFLLLSKSNRILSTEGREKFAMQTLTFRASANIRLGSKKKKMYSFRTKIWIVKRMVINVTIERGADGRSPSVVPASQPGAMARNVTKTYIQALRGRFKLVRIALVDVWCNGKEIARLYKG